MGKYCMAEFLFSNLMDRAKAEVINLQKYNETNISQYKLIILDLFIPLCKANRRN